MGRSSMTCRFGLAFALILLVSACSGGTSKDMYRQPDQPKPDNKPVVKERPKPQIDPQRLAAIKAHGLDKAMHPKKLVGLESLDVSRLLGKPNFVRRDKGVEIWQYRHADCILDLFLYESERKGFLVDHTELRGPKLNDTTSLSCFSKIVKGQS